MTLRQLHQDALLPAGDAARIRQVLVACSQLLSWAEADAGPQFAAAAQDTAEAAGLSRAPGPGRRGEPGHRHAGLLRCGPEQPVTGPAAPPLPAELDALLRRMRLPYLRKAAPDVLATARAQRREPAEVLRVLLAEEVTGRDAATRRMRRKIAGFPSGKTFSSWQPEESSISAATQDALATLEWYSSRTRPGEPPGARPGRTGIL